MSAENNERMEFRYYDMPQKCPVICLYGDRWKMPYGTDLSGLHFHNVLEIGICREGSGIMRYLNEEKQYRPGDISIIPKNIAHTTLSDWSWWEYVYIDAEEFLERFLWKEAAGHRWLDRIQVRAMLLRRETHEGIWTMVETMLREDQRGGAYHSEVKDTCALQLLFLIARENKDYQKELSETQIRDEKIRGALDYVEEHYAEEVTVAMLAASSGLSETHFRRVFTEIMNMTPGEYLNMIRVRHACRLLLSTDLPVELVGEQCGYMTPSTFNRNFQSYLHTTPLQWRKSQIRAGNRGTGIQITAFRGWGQEVTGEGPGT